MQLVAGNQTHKAGYTAEDHAIVYFRNLGYSLEKTRKMLRMDLRKFKKTQGSFGVFGKNKKGMHTKYKDKQESLIQLKRFITDLGLYHQLTMYELTKEINETVDMVEYAKNRRKK